MNATNNPTHDPAHIAANGEEPQVTAGGGGRGSPEEDRSAPAASRVRGARTIMSRGSGPPCAQRSLVGPQARRRPRRLAIEVPDPSAPRVTSARRALGRYGEDLAARHLTAVGMRILDRNWRCQEGEVDIVAADGDALVLCEVKARRAGAYEHPMAAVRPEKAARLRRLAERWLEQHGGPPPGGVRIDVIGVVLPSRGAPLVEHVRGAT